MPAAYIDSSALLKLVVRENETSALEADLAERDGLVVSAVALVECRRAAGRAGHKRLLQRVDELFEAVYLIAVTPAILERAARSSRLRSARWTRSTSRPRFRSTTGPST